MFPGGKVSMKMGGKHALLELDRRDRHPSVYGTRDKILFVYRRTRQAGSDRA